MNEDKYDAKSSGILRVVRASMALPGARVSRADFLRAQLHVHCSDGQIKDAIELGPASAGISLQLTDEIADSVIRTHTVQAAGLSFATGLPSGIFMAATIPLDVAQFFWHAIVIAQKLVYLYGWPDLFEPEVDLDEETELRIVVLIAAMLGAANANRLLTEISSRFARETVRRIPRYALTKTAYYPLVKVVLRWVGVKVTKQSFARVLARAVPIVGGVLSASVTVLALRPMAKRLKGRLRELSYARPTET